MNQHELKFTYMDLFTNYYSSKLFPEVIEYQYMYSSTSTYYASYCQLRLVFSNCITCSNTSTSPIRFRMKKYLEILQNSLMENQMDVFIYVYTKLLHMRRIFGKLARVWKWRKTETYNAEDLFTNPIQEGQKNTITLIQTNRKYVFNLRELINTFNRELSNSPNLFVNPIACKNPYTNIVFNKSSLYNIYFALRNSTYVIPTLFHNYFMCDFDLNRFMHENEHFIRESYVDEYFRGITNDVVHQYVNNMFREFNISNCVDKHFPADKLNQLMTPYLKLYSISSYSENRWKKMSAFVTLYHKIQKIKPGFGRYICKGKKSYSLWTSSKPRIIVEKNINDDLPDWNETESSFEFLKSHSYKTDDIRLIQEYNQIIEHLQKYGIFNRGNNNLSHSYNSRNQNVSESEYTEYTETESEYESEYESEGDSEDANPEPAAIDVVRIDAFNAVRDALMNLNLQIETHPNEEEVEEGEHEEEEEEEEEEDNRTIYVGEDDMEMEEVI